MIIETRSDALPTTPRPRPRAPRPRRLILLAASLCYLLLVAGIWFTFRGFGDRAWPATVLFLGPRWPLAAPLLALWPWALMTRRILPIVATGLATGVLLVPILGVRLSWPTAAAAAPRGDIRIVTCNVHRQHLDAGALREYIADIQPDIVALQGWSDVNKDVLFGGGTWEIHREGELLVASRFPLGKVTPLDFADTSVPLGERGSAASFELLTPRGPIHLINLHLASPHAGLLSFTKDSGDKLAGNILRRRRESEMVRAMADRLPGPLLLTGDFNTTDDSPIFREHWGDLADAFSERGSGLGYTYLVGHTQLRIDHILAGPAWEVANCWVGPKAGSPHRPLVADVNYR